MYRVIVLFLLFGLSSCFILQQYEEELDAKDNPNLNEQKEENTYEDSISSYLTRMHKDNYQGYTFGSLFVNKPTEVKELEQLYETRNSLPSMRDVYGDRLDSMIIATDTLIAQKKREIKENKVYPTYELNHLYTIDKDSSYRVQEATFHFYPNKTILDVRSIFYENLDKEEKELFAHFIQQKPLITRDYSTLLNESIYENMNNALDFEPKETKGELLKTTLQRVKFYLVNNGFDADVFTNGSIVMKLKLDYNVDKPIRMSVLKELTEKHDDLPAEKIIGYSKFCEFQKTDSLGTLINSAIYCEFDNNYVLKGVLPVEGEYEHYFE